MELKWLGHATWLLTTQGKTLYLDPYAGEYQGEAYAILCTHHHDDHCKPEKVEAALGEKTVIIAPEECGRKLGREVVSLKPGESWEGEDVKVTAVEAYNVRRFRSPGNPFHPKGVGVGYIIEAEGKRVYHMGDTDFIEEMKDVGPIDVMLVPSGGTYTMDNEEAAEATKAIRPKVAIPMHIWETNPREYKKLVESSCETKVIILEPGETHRL